jgi:hypothetical protein
MLGLMGLAIGAAHHRHALLAAWHDSHVVWASHSLLVVLVVLFVLFVLVVLAAVALTVAAVVFVDTAVVVVELSCADAKPTASMATTVIDVNTETSCQ